MPHFVLGAGRWGRWLARRLQYITYLRGIIGFRESATTLAEELQVAQLDIDSLRGGIVWVCVPDDAIAELVRELDGRLAPGIGIVHASGATPLPRLDRPTGVVWPVQSITAEVEPDWARLPLVIQANGAAFAKTVYDVAERLSETPPKPVETDEERLYYHLGACFTQNYTNLLWTLIQELYDSEGLDTDVLLPLALNHLEKLKAARASDLQTGPAARGDQETMRRHLEVLGQHLAARRVYVQLAEAIIDR